MGEVCLFIYLFCFLKKKVMGSLEDRKGGDCIGVKKKGIQRRWMIPGNICHHRIFFPEMNK